MTVMTQARKCRELEDRLRNLGVRSQFAGLGATAEQSSVDIPSQIAQLAQLRDQGILSDSEFDAKKAQLLDRL